MNDVLWTDDISVLLNKENVADVWPSEFNTLHENYNAMTRFMILYTVMLSLYKQHTLPFAMLFMFMIIFYLFYNLLYKSNHNHPIVGVRHQGYETPSVVYNDIKEPKPYPSKHCKSSTETNPFMNPMLGEAMTESYKPICDYETDRRIDNNFVNTLPQSEWDIYNNQNSQRQFYTIPNHTSYADQSAYASWLYGDGNRKV